MARKMKATRMNEDNRKDEPAIIVGECGRQWLCVVDPLSWNQNGHKHKNKLDVLLPLGKMLPGESWQEVTVDIIWNNNERSFDVKRQYCDPYYFDGEVIYACVK